MSKTRCARTRTTWSSYINRSALHAQQHKLLEESIWSSVCQRREISASLNSSRRPKVFNNDGPNFSEQPEPSLKQQEEQQRYLTARARTKLSVLHVHEPFLSLFENKSSITLGVRGIKRNKNKCCQQRLFQGQNAGWAGRRFGDTGHTDIFLPSDEMPGAPSPARCFPRASTHVRAYLFRLFCVSAV